MSNKILGFLVIALGLTIGGIEYNKQSLVDEPVQPINPAMPRIEAPQPKVEPQPQPQPTPPVPPQKQNPRRGNGGGSC